MAFIVINRNPQGAIIRQQPPYDLQPVAHQRQPDGMLQSVIVVSKGAARIVRWVDKDALDLARKLRLQRF